MILETMTREEVFKEIEQDEIWLMERGGGLMKKYSKQLRDKRYEHLEILGMTTYTTPNNNKVHCVIQKYYADKSNKYAILALVSLYEYRCGDKLRYVYPIYHYGVRNKLKDLVIFSEHAVQRMNERLGKDMFEVFKDICTDQDTCVAFAKYDYNGRDDEMIGRISDGIAFACTHEWGVVVSTIISTRQKFDTQIEGEALSLRNMIEGSKELENIHEWFLKNDKIYKEFCFKQRA